MKWQDRQAKRIEELVSRRRSIMGIVPSTPAAKRNAFEPAAADKKKYGRSTIDDDDANENSPSDDICWRLPLPLAGQSSPPPPPPSTQNGQQSKGHTSAPSSSRTRSLPKPKKLLWGCSNAEEHYAYIVDACARVENLQGEAGLRELGLEYRMVHNPLVCTCDVEMDDDDDLRFLDPPGREEEKDGLSSDLSLDDRPGEYMVPIGTPLKASTNAADNDDNEQQQDATCNLCSRPQGIDPQDIQDIIMGDDEDNDDPNTLTTSPSNVSLFSLATHHTWSSTEDRDGMDEMDDGCALRLVRVFPPSIDRPPTLIEADNYETFIANGKMYDEVSRLSMEYSQTIMRQEGDLCWITICEERGIRALVSRNRVRDQAAGRKRRRNVLLIVTGKGKVRAGIFSRRHIITTGIEASTALPMVREARKRDMDIVILDPNANGDVNGMDTVDASLRRLFPTAAVNDDEAVYIVAHSAAGAQIVRYLLGDKQVGTSANSSSKEEGRAFLRLIRAIAFTDSNHNINWTKKTNPELTEMLVGPSCLYIKSHKLHHDEPKELGKPHHDCQFWKHRFGEIRTIWAGTHEHALTNYTPRFYIWDHFDSFIDNGITREIENGEEKALSF